MILNDTINNKSYDYFKLKGLLLVIIVSPEQLFCFFSPETL